LSINWDPDALTITGESIDTAVDRVPGWMDRLGEVADRLSGQNCDNGFGDFSMFFKLELDAVQDVLEGFKGVLVNIADCVRQMDKDVAFALTPREAAPIPVPGGDDVAV
jgi:hypothetical protein